MKYSNILFVAQTRVWAVLLAVLVAGGRAEAVVRGTVAGQPLTAEPVATAQSRPESGSSNRYDIQWPYVDPIYAELIKKSQSDPARYTELWRPQFHYSMPQQGMWKGDVMGFSFINGWWTPFLYRFVNMPPNGKGVPSVGMGMARSRDLIYWEHLPNSIPPMEKGRAAWLGRVVHDRRNQTGLFDDAGGYVFVHNVTGKKYTDHFWNIMYSRDGFDYVPYAHNPLKRDLSVLSKDYLDKCSFDGPCMIWHEPTKHWIAVANDPTIFVSKNLLEWRATQGFDAKTLPFGGEGPDLFVCPLDDNRQNMQFVFTYCHGTYYVADLNQENFTFQVTHPDPKRPSNDQYHWNYGPDAMGQYACKEAPDGRIVGLGTFNTMMVKHQANLKYMPFPINSQTFPVEYSLRTTPVGMQLFQQPVREIERLYIGKKAMRETVIKPDANPIADWTARLADIELVFRIPSDSSVSEFGLNVYKDKGGVQTTIGYDRQKNLFFVDRSRSGYASDVPSFGRRYTAPLEPDSKGRVHMRVLCDESLIEAFGGDGHRVISSVVFAPPTADGLGLYAMNGEVVLESIELRQLKNIWRTDAEENGTTPLRIRVQPRLVVKPGESKYLGARVWPDKSAREKMIFNVDRPEIARVTADGNEHFKVEGLSEGVATIALSVPGTQLRATCELVVSASPPEKSYDKTSNK